MRILHINKYLWLSGGVERYLFDVADACTAQGHEILYFSQADSRNRPTDQDDYFVPSLDYATAGLAQAKTIFERTLYSREVKDKLAALIRDQKPDIAHIHQLYHHLSPSVLDALTEVNIPIVQTVHDYKLICPNYRLYSPQEQSTCTRCVQGDYSHCLKHKCIKGAYLPSALAKVEMTHHKRKQYYKRAVDKFICTTQFVKDRLDDSPMPSEKLVHLPLYINLDAYTPTEIYEPYLCYVGRLAPEKGVLTLIRAMQSNPDIPLKIIGDGPIREECEALIAELGLSNIELLGFLERDAMTSILGRSSGLIIPSEWYEPCGLTAWEAHALKRPVIGANIGGIPESITEGKSGLLFESGNAEDLSNKIQSLISQPELGKAMGEAGSVHVHSVCGSHTEGLMNIYAEVMNSSST